jgi:hypothetical protein
MSTKLIPIVILACCALFATAGCKRGTMAASEISASSGGRDIHVSAEGNAFVQTQEDRFTVKVTGHEIVIERERVLVDKKEGAKIPAGAKKFGVIFGGGTLTVGADGAEILKMPLAK